MPKVEGRRPVAEQDEGAVGDGSGKSAASRRLSRVGGGKSNSSSASVLTHEQPPPSRVGVMGGTTKAPPHLPVYGSTGWGEITVAHPLPPQVREYVGLGEHVSLGEYVSLGECVSLGQALPGEHIIRASIGKCVLKALVLKEQH